MGFNCGVIGLPNVGKSTIFNALSNAGAEMANYPFCTVEPNRGIVTVPDDRLVEIAALLKKENPIHTRIEFIDVAGLVKGASKGEGLGNKFLSHIRPVDAAMHVVRCFRSEDVAHVIGDVDPLRDIDIVRTELILSDIDTLERAKDKLSRLAGSGVKAVRAKITVLEKCAGFLYEGKTLLNAGFHEDEKVFLREFGLLTLKPVLYCANVDEGGRFSNEIKKLEEFTRSEGSELLTIQGKLEEEISEMSPEEKKEYLVEMGVGESGLSRLIESSYKMLGLITFYTAATQLQAWTVKKGASAAQAAGKIHTDFERGFIRAEVFGYSDLAAAGSEHHVREEGKLRSEGKEYIVKDGDIIRFLFNV